MPQLVPVTPQARVNEDRNAHNEENAAVAPLSTGGYVVAFEGSSRADGSSNDIMVRRYDASGNPVGGDFVVSSKAVNQDGFEVHPTITGLANGGFVVAWTQGAIIQARQFDANGVGGAIFRVEDTASNFYDSEVVHVTGLQGGGYVIAWQSMVQGGTFDIYAQVYNAAGAEVGGQFRLNNVTDGEQDDVVLAPLAGGGFVAVWESGNEVHMRRFGATGAPVANEVRIGTGASQQYAPDVTQLLGGGYVVTYLQNRTVFAQRYTDGGVAIGGPITAFAGAGDNFFNDTSVSALPGGGFLVGWTRQPDGYNTRTEFAARAFDSSGSPYDAYFVVEETFPPNGRANLTADGVTTLSNGNVVFTWDGGYIVNGEADFGVYQRLFKLPAVPTTGNDVLTGTANADTIDGLAGNDSISGAGGNDRLIGGIGNDTLDGGAGTDTLIGGAGNDTYINPLGDTIVENAGGGFDTILTNASFSLVTVANIERLELTGATPSFLRGNSSANQLIGNSGSNTLEGMGGDDVLFGLGGRDTIIGGMGRDQIAPGLERDTIVWNSVAESTSAGRDFISEFVFSVGGSAYESLDFHIVPTAVRAMITTGVLREASFDADLQTAVNATNLGANQAVLFDPNGGDLNVAGHIYLVVDANGVAGYQAGADYVVQFTSWYGTLTLANFI